MQLKELKEQIENSKLSTTFIIFKCDKTYIPRQYVEAISHILNFEIEYIDNIDSIGSDNFDIFGIEETNDVLRVFNCDTFESSNRRLLEQQNIIIISNKIDKDTENLFKNNIVEIPQLADWHIKDYVYSQLEGIDTKYLDWLIKICNQDIDRIQCEIDKLKLFEPGNRQHILQQMVEENAYSDVSDKTIFDFISALVKRDMKSLLEIYEDIESIDIEDIGVVTLLYQNFKKYILVWMQNNPTPENTGLSSKQIWAINKLPKVWSSNQLIDIMTLLTEMDYKLKTGAIPVNMIRDYLVVNLLSR